MTEHRTALLDRIPQRTQPVDTDTDTDDPAHSAEQHSEATVDEVTTTHGPRPWNEGQERSMLYGLLFFFGLGLYAVAFVAWGVWLGS